MPFDFDPQDWELMLQDRIDYWKQWIKDHPDDRQGTIDFETRSAIELVGPKGVGAWIYAKHPTTEAMVLSFKLPGYDKPDRWHPSFNQFDEDEFVPETEAPHDLFAFILAGGLVEAHNVFFEKCIWRHVMMARHGWPEVPAGQWRCSASRASAASLPRALENACKAMGLPIEKDMEGNRLMKQMCKPRKPRKAEVEAFRELHGPDVEMPLYWHETKEKLYRLFDYCDQDVLAEEALSQVMPELPPRELELWQLDQDFNEYGVRFDLDMARAALRISDKNKQRLNAELFEMTGVLKGSQRQQIKDWLLVNEELELPDTTAPTLEKYIDGPMSDELSGRAIRILEIVRDVNKSSISKYKSALIKTDHDDWRARDLLMFCGAGTGRWSGKGIQVQNFPRGTAKNLAVKGKNGEYILIWDMDTAAMDILDEDEEWIASTYKGGVMEALSAALRGMVTADEDHELIAADYSAIEARCVLWEAGAEEALEVFRRGGDIYCDMAEGIYGYPVNKSDHPDERQFGKQAILGLGYGMGFITFLLTCKKYKISFSVDQVKGILKDKYDQYFDWVNDYLYPTGEKATKSKKQQAGRNRRKLIDADLEPKKIIHELALMKYTVDVYRKRYGAVKQMWSDQEEAAIACVQRWQDIIKIETDQWHEAWGKDTPYPIEKRDAIDGPVVKAGKISWYVRGGFLCCELPSGRLIRYRDPSVKQTKTAWGSTKPGLRYFSVVSPGNKWASTSTYGGKIVENITQAVARDIMADAMLRSRGTKYRVIMTVHDEMIAEVPKGEGSREEFEKLMSEIEPWAEGCPITAEAERYVRYRK